MKLAWSQLRAGLQYLEEECNNEPKERQDISSMEASMPPPPPQLQNDAGDGSRDEGESLGADDVRASIFLSGDLVRVGVEVAEVDGVECGDMHLKLLPARSPEGCVACEVPWRELHQGWDPLGGEIPLHSPKVPQPILVLTRYHTEQRAKDKNPPSTVNLQEDKTIEDLQAAPCETPQELIGGDDGLQKGAYI